MWFVLPSRETRKKLTALVDRDHRDYRYAMHSTARISEELNVVSTGPKVNSPEKLAELVRAGVNIGM